MSYAHRYPARFAWLLVLALVGVLAVAGCGGSDDDSSSDEVTSIGKTEGALNLIAWAGYAEDGSTDKTVDWVTPFEKQTGCQVDVKTFGTSNEAFDLLKKGGYDVVSASGDASLRMVYGDLVQPVNTSLVPNYADIFPGLKDKAWNTVDGMNYGIPHGRGANLLLYNMEAQGESPTSWADMWEADSPLTGKIAPYDDAIYIADAAVYLMATQPDLGITNPYSLDKTQFDAAIALLEQQKPLVGEYWADYAKQANGLATGSIVQGQGWQLTANVANADSEKVGATKPDEGTTGWSDTWMVAKDTPHLNCAHQWLDYIVSPEVNAEIAEYFGEAPANSKSCELTQNEDHCAQFHADTEDYWTNVWYWTTPTEQCLDGRTDATCVPYKDWVAAWTSLRSS